MSKYFFVPRFQELTSTSSKYLKSKSKPFLTFPTQNIRRKSEKNIPTAIYTVAATTTRVWHQTLPCSIAIFYFPPISSSHISLLFLIKKSYIGANKITTKKEHYIHFGERPGHAFSERRLSLLFERIPESLTLFVTRLECSLSFMMCQKSFYHYR